ncbi:MAG: GAF domain-containing protein [Anaerolineales bacterium]|nr:GAF domain-containing protein [Anaerolineales bacterium]
MIVTRRLLLTALLVLGLVFIILALFLIRDSQINLQSQEASQLNNLNQALQSQIDAIEQLTLALARQVSNNQDIQNAFANKDRALLENLSLVPFVELSTLHGISEQTFHTPPAMALLSLNDPDSPEKDEAMTRLTVVAANTRRREVSSIEMTSSGLNMWSVAPVNVSVGTVEILAGSVSLARGIDIRLLRELKSNYQADWQLLINRQKAESVNYDGLANLRPGPLAELSLQASTLGSSSAFAEPEIYRQALLGKTTTSIVNSGGVSYALMSVPLRDFSGDVVAVIDILVDRTEIVAQERNRLVNSLLIVFAGAILASAALIFTSWRVLGPIRDLTTAATAVAQGDLERSVEVKTSRIATPFGTINLPRDEIGLLADSFNSMTLQLSDLVSSLEERVAERTRDLERRSTQFRIAAEIARDTTAVQGAAAVVDVGQLLKNSVDQIRQRFDFYHVGIFLVGEGADSNYAVLRAATGEAGQVMLQRGHKLRVGRVGIVGAVTGSGRPRVALNVDEDAAHFKNPLLPETRAEMALPMRVGEQVIGALDVQSRQPRAFDEDDITILQTIADQLAVAIQNAHLIQELNQTVAELEQAYGRFTQKSWSSFIHGRQGVSGYAYRSGGLQPLQRQMDGSAGAKPVLADLHPEALQALREGQAVILNALEPGGRPGEPQGPGASTEETPEKQAAPQAKDAAQIRSGLAAPIRLRDQVIGVLNLRLASENVPPETIALIEEAASRLGLVLESARLLHEAQRLALREQQINWIANQVRGSVNLETILQNTVRELGRALGASRTYIQVGSESTGGAEARERDESA